MIVYSTRESNVFSRVSRSEDNLEFYGYPRVELTNLEMYFVGDLTVRGCVKNCIIRSSSCFYIPFIVWSQVFYAQSISHW